ncbi:MAG: hypothetical protein HZB85_09155 [Deltaproteobacteria bacterium]|nr:hypothetical protein [Deltaproteobacteria bacterium]
MKLIVHQVDKEDVYRDIVRIPEVYRLDASGSKISEGTVCKITANGQSSFAILRGLKNETRKVIRVDGKLRDKLKIKDKDGEEVRFDFKKVGLCGEFMWAWDASDPAYRVAARLALLSVILGLLGLMLGVFGVWK